jgi:hypothetical protein
MFLHLAGADGCSWRRDGDYAVRPDRPQDGRGGTAGLASAAAAGTPPSVIVSRETIIRNLVISGQVGDRAAIFHPAEPPAGDGVPPHGINLSHVTASGARSVSTARGRNSRD